jgi:geranylgeranyl pyrophosphate synthase
VKPSNRAPPTSCLKLAIVRSTGALDATRQAAHNEAMRAMQALDSLPANTHTDAMRQLASQPAAPHLIWV